MTSRGRAATTKRFSHGWNTDGTRIRQEKSLPSVSDRVPSVFHPWLQNLRIRVVRAIRGLSSLCLCVSVVQISSGSEMTSSVAPLVEHFFRHEAGRLVAVLTRIFGRRNFELVEDMVQATLADALQAWRVQVPDNPAGWVHRVAKNKILDALRRDAIGARVLAEWAATHPQRDQRLDELFVDAQIEDSQLRMMFASCHPSLARENQVAFTLKTLCGFGNSEIARALLVGEETVKKRLQRARQHLIDQQIALDPPVSEELAARLDAVHQVLYLLFNEGHSASAGDTAIRADLCEEAARLCHLLCTHPRCANPATHALMALMLFHAARLDARLDDRGGLLLMEAQDRSKRDTDLI